MCSSLEVVTMTKWQVLAVGLILTLGGSMSSHALIGQVLNLDGQGDYVEIADSPSLHASGELTVTGWFRSDRMERTWQVIFWKGDTPDHSPYNNREFSLFLQSNGSLELSSTGVDNRRRRILTPAQIRVGQWYHFATVISAQENAMRIFVNGELTATGTYDPSGIKNTGGPLRLGNLPNREHYAGLIDEVRLWNRALTQAEILDNMNRPLEAGEEDLFAHYTFDGLNAEGLVEDLSGKGNHARLVAKAHLKEVRIFMPPVSFKHAAVARQDTHLLVQVGRNESVLIRGGRAQSEDMMVRTAAPPPTLVVMAAPQSKKQTRHWSPENYYRWEDKWHAPRDQFGEIFDYDGVEVLYNRVEGLYGGYSLPRTYYEGTGLANYGELGYSLTNEDWRYQLGAELFSFYTPSQNWGTNLAAMGAEFHDLTDNQDGWLLPQDENSMDAVLFKRDFYDYYRRQGWSLYSAHNFGGVLHLKGQLAQDEFTSLDNQVDWIVWGNRFAAHDFRANPAIDEGTVNSLRTDVQLDTRDHRQRPRRGWFINSLFERAGGFLEGDYEFKRYLMDARRYQPLDRGTRLDLRVRLGSAKGFLPRQYLYDIGGFASLRGYNFKEFSGDRMVLVNAEYWIDGNSHWRHYWPADDFDMGVFFDAGSAWFAEDRSDPFAGLDDLVDKAKTGRDIKTSAGFAIGMEDLRLYLAKPLDADGRDWAFSMRISQTF